MIQPDGGRRYWNPYVAGVLLGLVVTGAFLAGHYFDKKFYFGASRVFTEAAKWLAGKENRLGDWMSLQIVGIFAGGLIGSMIAGRFRPGIDRGGKSPKALRLGMAVLGGALVMLGSRFAAGCTSGLALSGGLRLSTGAFVFMGTMFAGGFLGSAVARRLWS